MTHVPLGAWGGEHVQLTVNETVAAAEFDCAHGTLDQPLVVDRDGRFSVAGTFVREHGGPIREGEAPDVHPARYSGVTDGRTMTLDVALTDQPQTVGSFTLVFGTPGRVVKCL